MLQMLKTYIDTHWHREEGASGVEYAILIGIIAVALIAGATLLAPAIQTTFTNISGQIPAGGGGG